MRNDNTSHTLINPKRPLMKLSVPCLTSGSRMFTILFSLLLLLLGNVSIAQNVPFTFKNTSTFADADLYIAIVGEDLTGPPGAHVWVDCKTGVQKPMSPSYNTITGPVYGGNKGPGTNAKYADCFTKLSDVPNKTINVAGIQGCRIFISVKSQLYLYFFGSTGSPSGYTSPSSTDPTDPNTGIIYEIIELTNNQYGIWANTSRVDAYHYAMGMEMTNTANVTIKTGELKNHDDIGTAFKANVPTEFQGCYDATSGEITCPTKTTGFADGSIGSMPNVGPYVNYMKPYIDAIWAKYANEDLIFSAGDAGTWKGRVINEQLVMTCTSGGFLGRKGIIARRPTTQEAFEGKGVLNNVVQDAPTDLMIEAQICAAITRHVINTTTPNVGQQDWSDPTKYYLTSPCNHYAKFWHLQGISVNQLSYGFAYDDVFSQSSTLYSGTPKSVTVYFGGFAPTTPVVESPYLGTRWAIPGTVEAENYDLGGQNLAYNDVTTTNDGGAYRTDAVDIEAMSGGGYDVGYIAAGEWLKYMVNITTAGKYRIEAYIAATADGKSFTLDLDGTSIATVNVINTGAWATFQKVTIDNISLTAGQKTLRMFATTADFNLDKIVFSLMPNVAPTVSVTAPTTNSAFNAGATITITANAADSDGSILKVEFYDGTTLLSTDATSPYSYTWTNAAVGNHTITAKAYDNSTGITTSSAITIKVATVTTDIADKLLAPKGYVYPNPTTGILNISADITELELTDIEGKTQPVHFTTGATNIDLSILSNGIYILRLKTATEVRFEKIIKTH